MNKNDSKISSFKKFSEINKGCKVNEEPDDNSFSNNYVDDMPCNPNLSKKTDKEEKTASLKNIIPVDKENLPEQKDSKNESVKKLGKVAKFPKNTKASKAYNFLENIKISKKSIWYIIIEKNDNELQMVKYNYKEGVNLSKFINELKSYYIEKYNNDSKICESINNIQIDGNDKYSIIKNIPIIEIDNKKVITKITEDLIKLLSE
jgi:hypothetical protein